MAEAVARELSEAGDARAGRLAREAVARFGLELGPFTVFTEAASGHFRWTAVLALLAGARRVYALARDSRWASAAQAGDAVLALARAHGVEDRLEVVGGVDALGEADIVTNLGFVRPLDAERIARLKPTAVVPLMWETWEFRAADLDLAACEARGILVLGTDERHPDLGIFGYVGVLGLRLLLEAGIELCRSRVLVAGGGTFGESAAQALRAAGAQAALVCAPGDRPAGEHAWLGATLADPAALDFVRSADAVLFMEHHAEGVLVGPGGPVDAARLAALNPGLRVAHVSGRIDAEGLRARGIEVVPARIPEAARTMSVTTGYLGPRPVIDLHAAGLRVGQAMAEARRAEPDPARARVLALRHPLCQDFAPGQLAALGVVRP